MYISHPWHALPHEYPGLIASPKAVTKTQTRHTELVVSLFPNVRAPCKQVELTFRWGKLAKTCQVGFINLQTLFLVRENGSTGSESYLINKTGLFKKVCFGLNCVHLFYLRGGEMGVKFPSPKVNDEPGNLCVQRPRGFPLSFLGLFL